MNILLVEPFLAGSHKAWAEGLKQHSQHRIELLCLPGRHWKWRMHGAAISLAEQFLISGFIPDLVLVTDMLDLSVFVSLTKEKLCNTPIVLYMHENQLSYPWSPQDADVEKERDHHYGFINYTSCLSATAVWFNSEYNRSSFLGELKQLLKRFPDHNDLHRVDEVLRKSKVMPLGIDLTRLDEYKPITSPSKKADVPVVLWNHRWEFDKNPDAFFAAMRNVKEQGVPFQLVVLGENYKNAPPVFSKAKVRFAKEILHWGYAESLEEYAQWLWKADVLPVTSNQDFFGVSTVEAIYCNCHPLLPNRLAFPEHLDDVNAFYKKENELPGKLTQIFAGKRNSYRDAVSGYDWSHMAIKYDVEFARLTENYSGLKTNRTVSSA